MLSERFHQTRKAIAGVATVAALSACAAEPSSSNPTTYELTCDSLLNSVSMEEGLEYTIKVKSRSGKIRLQKFAHDILINGDGKGENALQLDDSRRIPLNKKTTVKLSQTSTGITRASVYCD